MGKALPTASAISLTLMMILCSMSGLFTPLPTILENENENYVQSFQWTRTVQPPGGEGFQADYWRPDTTGALWAIDFSPDGSKIAGVDINENFVNYWLHNGMLNLSGKKMSKSDGNVKLLNEYIDEYSGEVVRFFFLRAHYRSPQEFSEHLLQEAKKTLTNANAGTPTAKKVNAMEVFKTSSLLKDP